MGKSAGDPEQGCTIDTKQRQGAGRILGVEFRDGVGVGIGSGSR